MGSISSNEPSSISSNEPSSISSNKPSSISSNDPSSITSTPPTTFFEGQDFTISKPESRFSNEDGFFSIPLSYSQVGKSVSFIQLSLMEETCTNVTTESVIALSPSTSAKFERGNFTAPQVTVDTTKFSSSILV